MDPRIVAAIISTAGVFAGKLLDAWHKTPVVVSAKDEVKTQVALGKAIEQHYGDLQSGLSSNSVKVLRFLEGGDPKRDLEIWQYVFPENEYAHEFGYRLRYLETLGLIKESVQAEYRITRLGRGFLEEARKRGDFKSTLHP